MREEPDYRTASGLRSFGPPDPATPALDVGVRRQRIDRVLVALSCTDPELFDEACYTYRRYGLPASSFGSGPHGNEQQIPLASDGFMRDRLDRKLRVQERLYDEALNDLEQAIRDLEAAHRFIVPLSADKARQALVDDSPGEYRFHCYGCDMVFKRTATQRPRSLRCSACYQWWIAAGRPDTNTEAGTGKTPKPVVEARIARESRKATG